MRRIKHPTRVTARPAQTYSDAADGGFFGEADAPNGTAATRVPADWLNDLQETVLAPILAAGHTEVAGSAGDAFLADAVKLLGHAFPQTVVNSTPYNITIANVTDRAAKLGRLYAATGAAAAITINLPPTADAGDGGCLIIKKSDASANAITIDGNGSETIDGAASLTLDTQHDAAMLVSNGTAWHIVSGSGIESTVTGVMPAGHLSGLTLANNGTDPTNDVDVAVGRARSDDDAIDIVLAAALTKRLDATFVAGTGAGGLDTGAKANSTAYHVFAIASGTGSTVDVLLSASASPSMPSGYTKNRRIGTIWTDGSGVIRPFVQDGDLVFFKAPPLDVNNTTVTLNTASNLTLTVPPDVRVEAFLNVRVTGADAAVYLRPTDADSLAATAVTGGAPLASLEQYDSGNPDYMAGQARVLTDTSRRVAANAKTNHDAILHVATLGWRDRRGKG